MEEEAAFLTFLRSLPEETRLRLMQDSHFVFFLFRLLSPSAQTLLLNCIWNAQVGSNLHMNTSGTGLALELLTSLGILLEKDGSLAVQPNFLRCSLKASLQGAHRCAGLVAVEKKKKKERDTEKKSNERWECVLRYLALPSDSNIASVSERTRSVFRSAGFSSASSDDAEMEITSAGFQFLLLNPIRQIWTYVIEWLKLEMSEGKDLAEILSVLLRVTLCVDDDVDKRAFQVDPEWNETQMDFLMHLRELGLIFMRKRKDGVFQLTTLLTHLAAGWENAADSSAGGAASSSSKNKKMSTGMIVETNFRVYAYTSSSLTLAILSSFCSMAYRFHDMSVGILTRDSVRQALQVGITADQIISFLKANAHPQSAARKQVFPITVADQISLWEDERKRLTFTDAALYSAFESETEYQDVITFAKSQSVLIFSDPTRKLVVVTQEGHEKVKCWWKERSQQNSSQ